jgi:hypothetical protein
MHIGLAHVKKTLAQYNMKITVMVFTDGLVVPGAPLLWGGPFKGFSKPSKAGESDKAKLVREHLAVWKEQVEAAQFLEPTLVVSHSLKDYFTIKMAEDFFTEALKWEAETGYIVCHETHRKRFLYSPWVARDFVPKFPTLKITADLSHWINVAETNTDDPDLTKVTLFIAWPFGVSFPSFFLLSFRSSVRPSVCYLLIAFSSASSHFPSFLVIFVRSFLRFPLLPHSRKVIEDLAPHVWHTHCRVGYDHGPQVPDPRAPEWIPYMEGHEKWWDAIWKAQAARGQQVSTMIAEHGPPNYQQCIPRTQEPVASIWDVNHWVSLRRQRRFEALFGAESTSKLVPSSTQGFLPETNPGDSVLKGKGPVGFLGDGELQVSRKAASFL